MGKFKLRSVTADQEPPVIVYFDDTKEDWVSLKPSVGRADFYKVAGKTVASDTEDRIHVSADTLFTTLVVDWSVVDEKDKPVPPSIEALERLDMEFQTWIDRQVQEQFQKNIQGTVDEAEGKSETPPETSDSEEI